MRARATPRDSSSSRSRGGSGPEKAKEPRGAARAVAFVALVGVLFVASFSSSLTSTSQLSADEAAAVEASVRKAAQVVASSSASAPVVAEAAAPKAQEPPAAARQQPEPGVLLHEVDATAVLPPPLKPVLPVPPALNLPAKCHAREHTELEGGVVQWGSSHKKPDAAACCEACAAHAAAHQDRPCNLWVHCSDEGLCGAKLGECWLKHTPDPSEPPSRGSGGRVPWTSGALLPPGGAKGFRSARRWARAAAQRAPLTVLEAAELTVGLRNESGSAAGDSAVRPV